MKPFRLMTGITEYATFADFAKESNVGAKDLVITNSWIYEPKISSLNLGCMTCFQEKYGNGEPTDEMVNAILKDLRELEYDRIIAVGGGTVIDIAKVLAVASKTDEVDDLYDNMASLKKVHPLTIVPTTCGTGSEVTNISIINRLSKGVKMGIATDALYADEAALITDMLASLPYFVYATSSIDAMVHAVESLLSPNACDISKMFSTAALELILDRWVKSTNKGGEEAWKEYAADFLRASNLAGIGFGYAGCAAVHATAYPLGGTHHVPHGQSNQMMFESVMKMYKKKQPTGRINDLEDLIARIIGCDAKDALPKLYELMNKVLAKASLKEKECTKEELPVFAKSVIETQQRLLNNNYVALTEAEVLEIYEDAFE